MARRCLCSRLLAALRDDPRLATLPLADRMFFLLVADAAARAPEPGLLPFGDPRRVALLVSCTETEAGTHIEFLIGEGLIRVERGGLGVPLLLEAAARVVAARANGQRGGRPRKGESAEEAHRRRQGHLALPIEGGGAAPKPTETETPKPIIVSTSTSGESDSQGEEAERSARAPVAAWVSLGADLAGIAGMDGARGGYDYRPVQGWLDAGIAQATIRAAVADAVRRPGYRAGRVFSLRYFDSAVREAHERAPLPPSPARRDSAEEAAIIAEVERIKAAALGRHAA